VEPVGTTLCQLPPHSANVAVPNSRASQ